MQNALLAFLSKLIYVYIESYVLKYRESIGAIKLSQNTLFLIQNTILKSLIGAKRIITSTQILSKQTICYLLKNKKKIKFHQVTPIFPKRTISKNFSV